MDMNTKCIKASTSSNSFARPDLRENSPTFDERNFAKPTGR